MVHKEHMVELNSGGISNRGYNENTLKSLVVACIIVLSVIHIVSLQYPNGVVLNEWLSF